MVIVTTPATAPKKIYQHLYVQVLAAIGVGIVLGATYPQLGQKMQPLGDSGIYLRGSDKSQVNIWCWPIGSGEVYGYRNDINQPAAVRKGVTPTEKADAEPGRWNRFRIRMVGDRLTVNLNGKTVVESAQLPGVPRKGPLALQHHGAPIEFANIYVREIKPGP